MGLQLLKEESLFAAEFSEFIRNRCANEPTWLRILREKSFAEFEQIGFPTVKEEDWKYTNVAPIAKTTFRPAWTDRETRLEAGDFSSLIYDESRDSSLVFINGVFQPEFFNASRLSQIVVMPFTEALTSSPHAPLIREHFERYGGAGENGFTRLNAALSDGVFVLIPANVNLDAPLELLFVTDHEQGSPLAVFPRVLIMGEENSSATIIESYASRSNGQYFTDAIVDFAVAHGARFQHYKLQRESTAAFHIADTRVSVGAGAKYEATTMNLGAALSRHNIAVTFDEEGGECAVDGLYLISGKQHSDTHSVIDHRQPHCTSHQLYKGVLDGRSHAVFNGKVFVRHGAQQTNAQQTNKNLLLSDEARVDTKPQLEIFADDVKCAHGAAVGQLDQDELFYLESRGINPGLARNLLTYGFAEEVIEKIKIDSIKRELDAVVLNRLHSGLEIA